MENYQPEILALCCNYCAFAAADLAGSMRLSYPPNVKIVRINCTGKLDILYILHAFEKGADGVFAAGWLEGQCHYLEGNIRAKKRIQYLKGLLDKVGIGGDRVDMYNISSSMGPQFAQTATEFTQRIKKLGPTPINIAKNR